MIIEPKLLPAQQEAFRYLKDDKTTEVLYGGAAGGGKSWLGCAWITTSALQYPGTRLLIGRSKLNALKETTMVTLFDLFSSWGIQSGIHYDYNQKDNYVQFKKEYGGSRILFKDLFLYPSDPEFDSLGSLEITGAFIDEGNQITVKAKNIVMSRIRYKLEEYKLIPKLLVTCNPAKNWVYTEFYRPHRDGTLEEFRKFVPAKVQDNVNISPHYVTNLEKLDPISRARLLDGSWEYDDDDTVLMDYDSIVNMFSISLEGGMKFITCDYGRFGKDPTVILVWDDWTVIEYRKINRTSVPEAVNHIRELQLKYKVSARGTVVDEAGNGSGVKDMLGCLGFVASHRPVYVKGTQENYLNLKAQCAYRFSEKVNKGEVAFRTTDAMLKEEIMQELEQIRRKDPDKDGKLNIEGKDVIREHIQRSTNWFDALMMRVLLDLKKRQSRMLI